jgi:16S rRNA (cytosine1402-N4)-methyltransferase
MIKNYHEPVLLSEAIEYLNLRKNGIYVDATLGGGGHSRAILQAEPTIRLISFDQDMDAIENANLLSEKHNVTLIHANFSSLWTELALQRIKKIDGILFDLGVSSHQIDYAQRGFSFMLDGDLDMRMNTNGKISAFDVINNYKEEELSRIFTLYGEERESRRIAAAIVRERSNYSIKKTIQLAEIIDLATRSHQKMKAKARIFQALRIYVNSELDVLRMALQDAVKILNPLGRIVVISYHSLEDRIVKHTFREEEKDCCCDENALLCTCNKVSTLHVLTKKPVVPASEEMERNSRARSAKLRAAEKKES